MASNTKTNKKPKNNIELNNDELFNEKGEVLVKNRQNKSFDYDNAQVILDVRHLKQFFRFGRGIYKYTKAVHDVSFKVYKGEVFGLVGESGCGKTTTGRSIIKLYQITSGDVWFKDVRIAAGTRWNEKEIKFTKIRLSKKLKELNKAKKEDLNLLKNNEVFIDKSFKFTANPKDFLSNELISKLNESSNQTLSSTNISSVYKEHIFSNNEDDKVNVNKEKQIQMNIDLNSLKNNKEFINKNVIYSVSLKDKFNSFLLENIKDNDLLTFDLINNVYQTLIDKEINKANEIVQTQRNAIKKAKRDNDHCNKLYAKQQVNLVNEKYKDIITKYNQHQINDDADKLLYQEYLNDLNKAKKAKITTSMQMIFQDPIASLNPRMTVREIIAEGLRIHGVKNKEEINEKVSQMLELVGLVPEHMNRYPHEFSGGQRQRIGIARALIMNPELIIADEPVSALDVSIQAQVINLLNDLREKFGLTILFIAHNLSVVKYFCDRIAVMYYGKLVEIAKSDELFKHPLHPYTKSLLSAVPEPDPNVEKGRKRILYNPSLEHDYTTDKPSLKEITKDHFVYCNLKEEQKYKESLKQNEEK